MSWLEDKEERKEEKKEGKEGMIVRISAFHVLR